MAALSIYFWYILQIRQCQRLVSKYMHNLQKDFFKIEVERIK
jgi:hypothetical protein